MPLSVAELIKLLDDAIQVADDPGAKKSVLKDLFQPMGVGRHAELDPGEQLSAEQAGTILQKIVTLTTNERKTSYVKRGTLRDARLVAMQRIVLWVGQGRGSARSSRPWTDTRSPSRWPCVSGDRVP